jgi:hypothetical protein
VGNSRICCTWLWALIELMFVIELLVVWVDLATLDSYGRVMYSWIVVPLGSWQVMEIGALFGGS